VAEKSPQTRFGALFVDTKKNRLIYVRSLGIAGGLMASFAGYTLYDVPGAVFGGFGAIVALEIIARMILRPRSGERVP